MSFTYSFMQFWKDTWDKTLSLLCLFRTLSGTDKIVHTYKHQWAVLTIVALSRGLYFKVNSFLSCMYHLFWSMSSWYFNSSYKNEERIMKMIIRTLQLLDGPRKWGKSKMMGVGMKGNQTDVYNSIYASIVWFPHPLTASTSKTASQLETIIFWKRNGSKRKEKKSQGKHKESSHCCLFSLFLKKHLRSVNYFYKYYSFP